MKKFSTHSSFVAKVGLLFVVLIVGAYAKPANETAIIPSPAPTKVVDVTQEIDANSLIRRVSYTQPVDPLLRLRKK